MPEKRPSLTRAPAIPAALFGIAAAVCLFAATQSFAHWQPPYVAAAVLFGATAVGLAFRSRAARWTAAAVSVAMAILMLVIIVAMAGALSSGMHSPNQLAALFSRVAWVFIIVPIALAIAFGLFAAALAGRTAAETFNLSRWDALVFAGILGAALLGARWHHRADFYGDPCRAGDRLACREFAQYVPASAGAIAPAEELCALNDSIRAPDACVALGLAALKAHDSTGGMTLLARACSDRPREFCYQLAHDPNLQLTPAQAAQLYGIGCNKGERASCEGLGTALRATGDTAGATNALETACTRGELSSCQMLGSLQLKNGDTVSALRWMKASCEYNSVGCRDIAAVEQAQGSTDGERWFSEGCQGRPPGATRDQCMAIATRYLASGDSSAARRYFFRACTWGLQPACAKLKNVRASYEVPRPGH